MKKILLVFSTLMLSCSISFAGTIETVGKAASNAGNIGLNACQAVGLLNEEITSTCDNVENTAKIAGAAATGYAVAGASGSSIMSTMATAGAAVGGGVVAGAGLVGGGAGLAGAKLMNDSLYTDCQDQVACDAAQYGTYTGAAAGTAASVGTLVVVGAGPAGLATIGAAVGGGMAAGAITVVAAPLVAAAVTGGTIYWLVSDDEKDSDTETKVGGTVTPTAYDTIGGTVFHSKKRVEAGGRKFYEALGGTLNEVFN